MGGGGEAANPQICPPTSNPCQASSPQDFLALKSSQAMVCDIKSGESSLLLLKVSTTSGAQEGVTFLNGRMQQRHIHISYMEMSTVDYGKNRQLIVGVNGGHKYEYDICTFAFVFSLFLSF